MKRPLTVFLAWLIGYYWERCPECGCGIAIMPDGTLRGWCKHP